MKFFLLFFLLVVNSNFVTGQELDFNYRFGFPTNYFRIEKAGDNQTQKSSFNRMKARYDMGAYLGYSHLIWRRFDLFAVGGIEFSQEALYLPILDPNGLYLEGVSIKNNRFAYQIGLKKRFKIWDDKLFIDLGVRIVDRYPFKSEKSYSSDYKFSNREWIEYKYQIETYHDGYRINDNVVKLKNYLFLNAQLNLDLSFQLNEKLRFTWNTTFCRNNFFYYNYRYSIRYYYNNSTTPNGFAEFLGVQGGYFGVLNDYLYTSFGVKYMFGK